MHLMIKLKCLLEIYFLSLYKFNNTYNSHRGLIMWLMWDCCWSCQSISLPKEGNVIGSRNHFKQPSARICIINTQVEWNPHTKSANTVRCYYNNIMMTSSNGNIFRVTGPLCGEFTGPGEFPTQRPVTRSFDVFFDLRLNKQLSKQPWGWWFETPSWSLWRHCNDSIQYPIRAPHSWELE